MTKITVDSLSDASNYAVIKLPERRFPAMLIQGDSLKGLLDLAQEIQSMAGKSGDDELRAAADEMVRLLGSRVEHYEKVLASENLPLPYSNLQKAV